MEKEELKKLAELYDELSKGTIPPLIYTSYGIFITNEITNKTEVFGYGKNQGEVIKLSEEEQEKRKKLLMDCLTKNTKNKIKLGEQKANDM